MKKKIISFNLQILLLLIFLSVQSFAEVVRQPYLQVITPTSVVIRWQTDVFTFGNVKYGTSLEKLDKEQTELGGREKIVHEVTVTGLQPSTKYYYTVDGTVEGSDDQYFITSPPVGSRVPVRIWVISDFGQKNTKDNQYRVKTVAGWKSFNKGYHADLVLSLGDQTEDDTRYQIQHNYFEQLQDVLKVSPLFTVVGNHDNHDGLKNYLKTFSTPTNGEAGGVPSGTKEYYSFDYANIHFVVLSTEAEIEGPQKEWLEKDLKNNKQEWLISSMHRPFHSGGHHRSDLSKAAQERRTHWLTLLEKYGLDLALQGHNHDYERSYLIDGLIGKTTSITEKNKIDTGDGRPDGDGAYYKKKGEPHQGTVFLEVTAGGRAADDFTHYSIFPVYYHSEADEGSVVIDVNGDRMDVKFLCNEKNDQGSHIWDHFSIIKTD